MIDFRPEPQTRLMVVAEVPSGRPALSAAWRAGAWPDARLQHLAHQDLVDRRSPGQPGALDGGPDRDATELGGRDGAQRPPNLPIGVRAALTM